MDKTRVLSLAGLHEGFANDSLVSGAKYLGKMIIQSSNQSFPTELLRTEDDKALVEGAKAIAKKAADDLVALADQYSPPYA